MTFLDSSVVIDYLDGRDAAVEYLDSQSPPYLTSPVCVYEVLAGEVFSTGPTDVERARRDFGHVETVPFTEEVAIEAARLQAELLSQGDPLSPRDLFVAAGARWSGETLAVSDGDFDTEGLRRHLSVTRI